MITDIGGERVEWGLPRFKQFMSLIRQLPKTEDFTVPEHRLCDFLIDEDAEITVYYSPLDHLNPHARIVFVGLTPARDQMHGSLSRARWALSEDGKIPAEAFEYAKGSAATAFGENETRLLIRMLDSLGINEKLDLFSVADLFFLWEFRREIHFTWALRFPTFFLGRSFSGYPNPISSHPCLRAYEQSLGEELALIPNALVVPLGHHVTASLLHLCNEGVIRVERCLIGLPRPVESNMSRFERKFDRLREQVERWVPRPD